MSCYDPLCKSAPNYFKEHHNFPMGSSCTWYWWRQKKKDREGLGEDWGECLLKRTGYKYGYRIPSETMISKNFELVVGNYECHQMRSEYNEIGDVEGIHV